MADRKAQGEEKVQAMLNRWVNMKREMALGELVRRPTNPLDINDLRQCQEWRTQTMQETAAFITDIQNAALGEHKIRALNDEINRLIREKSLWEDRIRQLGGPDYKKVIARQVDSQGQEIPGAEGYFYYGAAKDLPGVREYLQRGPPPKPVNNLDAILSRLDSNYYTTPEDPELLLEEERYEKELRSQLPYLNKESEYKDDTFNLVKESTEKFFASWCK